MQHQAVSVYLALRSLDHLSHNILLCLQLGTSGATQCAVWSQGFILIKLGFMGNGFKVNDTQWRLQWAALKSDWAVFCQNREDGKQVGRWGREETQPWPVKSGNLPTHYTCLIHPAPSSFSISYRLGFLFLQQQSDLEGERVTKRRLRNREKEQTGQSIIRCAEVLWRKKMMKQLFHLFWHHLSGNYCYKDLLWSSYDLFSKGSQ